MQKDTPFYCTMCLKQNNTFKMCKDCQKLICSQCDSRLRNICPFCKKNNNFTSVDLNNLQSKFDKLELCKEHNKPKFYYCEKCAEFLCESCALNKDIQHRSEMTLSGNHSNEVGLAYQKILQIEDIKPKIEAKKTEINKRIEQFGNNKSKELTEVMTKEKKESEEKIMEEAVKNKNKLTELIKSLKETDTEVANLINKRQHKESDLNDMDRLVNKYNELEKEMLSMDVLQDKKGVDHILNKYSYSSLIPPFIEIKNLKFQQFDKPGLNALFASFIHCGKKWRLFLKEERRQFILYFNIEGLKKSEVTIKVSLEIIHPQDKRKNYISSTNSFNIVTMPDEKREYEKMPLEFSTQNLNEYSSVPGRIILETNFRFQYDFFTSFISELEGNK